MYVTQVFDASGKTIADIDWYPVPTGTGVITARDANAALIAAAPETAAERDRLRAEKAELVAAIKQVETVCNDNAGPQCNHAMALNFVRDVARAVLAKATATEGGGPQ